MSSSMTANLVAFSTGSGGGVASAHHLPAAKGKPKLNPARDSATWTVTNSKPGLCACFSVRATNCGRLNSGSSRCGLLTRAAR